MGRYHEDREREDRKYIHTVALCVLTEMTREGAPVEDTDDTQELPVKAGSLSGLRLGSELTEEEVAELPEEVRDLIGAFKVPVTCYRVMVE